MRSHPVLLVTAAAALALVSGCSAPAATPTAESTSAPTSSSSSSSDEDTSSEASAPQVLKASVGTQSDPGAFEIALTDADGQPVTEVAAGDWTIEVQDYAKIHDFHLTGAGVDEATTVPGTGSTSWQVTLSPGEYDYVCDPHSGSMAGTLTVT